MNPEEILNSALNRGGKMIGGKELFALEGNAELNLFDVKTLDDVYFRNTGDFAEGYNNGWMPLAISKNKDDLWEVCRAIEQNRKSVSGNFYVNDAAFVLQGHPERNELLTTSLPEFLSSNNIALANKFNRGWLSLGIFADFDTAEESKTYIRLYFRDEKGTNLLKKRFDDSQK